MKLTIPTEFLASFLPEDLEVSLPSYQSRRAIEVAHKGMSLREAAREEGVGLPVMRKTLMWAVANMERASEVANS